MRLLAKIALLAMFLSPGVARGFSGSCSILAQKSGPQAAKVYAGSQAGFDAAKAYVGTNGSIFIYGGCEGLLTIGTLPDSVFVYAYDSAKWTIYSKAGSYRDRSGQARLDVDSLGIKVTGTAMIPRLGPASSAGSGGAIRIVDGVTFPTIASALADKVGGAAGTRGGVFDPDSARLFLGRFENNHTLNDPALDRARSVFSHDISIQGLNITETEAAHSWQTVWSGNGITGAAGDDRAVVGEWHDHELAAGAGNGLNLFRGEGHVTSNNSRVFSGNLTGYEFDTVHSVTTGNDTLNTIVGVESYAGIPTGGKGSITTNPVVALMGVGINNGDGTGTVAAINSIEAGAQVGAATGGVKLYNTATVTGAGGITGALYGYHASNQTVTAGSKYSFFAQAGSGPAVFEDSVRVNKTSALIGNLTGGTAGTAYSATFGQGATGNDGSTVTIRGGNGASAVSRLDFNRNTTTTGSILSGNGGTVQFQTNNNWQFSDLSGNGRAFLRSDNGWFRAGDANTPTHGLESATNLSVADSANIPKGLYLGGQLFTKGILPTALTFAISSIPAASTFDTTLTVTGVDVASAWECNISPVSASMPTGSGIASCRVTADNTVTARFFNVTASAINVPSQTWRVRAFK